jgi:hypothetical protein
MSARGSAGWLTSGRPRDRSCPGWIIQEIVSTDRHGLSETLVLMDDTKAVGMSLLWLVSGWEE